MKKEKIGIVILEIFLIVFALIYLYPIYQMVFTSLKESGEVINNPIGLPHKIALDNYVQAWNGMGVPMAFLSSIIITVGGLAFVVLFSSLASYPLARINIKLNKIMYVVFIAGIMLPSYTGIVPLVKLYKFLHLTNSYQGLIIFYIATISPYAIFLYTGFLKSVPKELEEAAIIDGCNEFQTFYKVIMPLMKTTTASIVIICSQWIWNDFLMPLVLISDPWKKPLSPTINYFFEKYNVNWNYAFAGFVMTVFPIVILFLFLQKDYVKGIAAGAVKG